MGTVDYGQLDFSKVDKLVAENRFYRARGVLDGMSSRFGYHPEIFKRLGDVMVALNEPKEAARFYFYSGVRDVDTSALSSSYLQRLHDFKIPSLKKAWSPLKPLIDDLPRVLRRSSPDNFSENLLSDLEAVGFDAGLFGDWRHSVNRGETLVLKDPSKPLFATLRLVAIWAFWAALVLVFVLGFAAVGAIGYRLLGLMFGR
jgi:hypothetical protein